MLYRVALGLFLNIFLFYLEAILTVFHLPKSLDKKKQGVVSTLISSCCIQGSSPALLSRMVFTSLTKELEVQQSSKNCTLGWSWCSLCLSSRHLGVFPSAAAGGPAWSRRRFPAGGPPPGQHWPWPAAWRGWSEWLEDWRKALDEWLPEVGSRGQGGQQLPGVGGARPHVGQQQDLLYLGTGGIQGWQEDVFLSFLHPAETFKKPQAGEDCPKKGRLGAPHLAHPESCLHSGH